MANYSAIKAAVNAYIKANGKKEITGRILNSVLNATIDSLGRYFQFAGGAMPTDDPGTPDQNVCYLAGEPGVYTNFGGIAIENEEVALLFWDGEWTKQRVLLGIQEVEASVDNQVGTPSVDVSYSGGQLVLTFHNLKGEQGIQGIQGIQGEQGVQGVQGVKGDTGAAAGFGTIAADINEGVGTPGVSVETSGDNTSKNIMFHFTNLKGETGVTSVVATIDETSGTPSCQVSLVNGVLTLAFSGLKGLKGDTGVSADYPITIYNGLDSDATDQALAAAQGKVLDGKISQLRQEVDGGNEERTPETEAGYYFASSGNNLKIVESSGSYHSGTIVDTSTPPTNGEDISMYIGKTLRITASNVATSSSRLAVILDENNMILSRVSENQYTQDSDGNYTYDLAIPSSAKWFFWSGVRRLVKIEILDAFVGLDERVQNLEGSISSENPDFVTAVTSLEGAGIAQSCVIASRYVKAADGDLGVSSSYDTRFMGVRFAKKIYVHTAGTSNAVAIAFYGANGISDLIAIYPLINGEKTFLLDVPTNAYMLGVSYLKTFTPTIQVAQGSKTPIVIATAIMEMGDMNITPSGYSYRYLNTRARTLYNTAIHLNAGDKVFTDGSVVLYYAGNTDSGYIYDGWVTEIPVYRSGNYVFVARFATEAAPADGDKKYITDHIFIQSNNAYQIIEDGKRILSPHNNWDRIVKSINHRGYCVMAPENTLPAFRLSKQMGFGYIETDIFFTADNEIVCIHDATVDRTSDGTGNVTDMTLAELKALDFGSWFSSTYTGTKIPTLEETLSLCHDLGIGCYIELKTQLSSAQAAQVYNTVKSCGMAGNISYISFALQPLQAMANVDKSARLGWLGAVTQENINNMLSLITDNQKVFIDSSDSSDDAVALCVDNAIEQEWWITEQEPTVAALPKSITGLTSNHLVAGRLFYLAAMLPILQP